MAAAPGPIRVVRLSATTTLAGSPPVVHRVDLDDDHPGGTFTIVGANLVLESGDNVAVEFFGPLGEFFDIEHADPAATAPIIQPTSPNSVTAVIPPNISSTHD